MVESRKHNVNLNDLQDADVRRLVDQARKQILGDQADNELTVQKRISRETGRLYGYIKLICWLGAAGFVVTIGLAAVFTHQLVASYEGELTILKNAVELNSDRFNELNTTAQASIETAQEMSKQLRWRYVEFDKVVKDATSKLLDDQSSAETSLQAAQDDIDDAKLKTLKSIHRAADEVEKLHRSLANHSEDAERTMKTLHQIEKEAKDILAKLKKRGHNEQPDGDLPAPDPNEQHNARSDTSHIDRRSK
jgi:hypothetical protein